MTKVVINTCYGGYGLSLEAIERYAELKGIKLGEFVEIAGGVSGYYEGFNEYDIGRTDPILVQVVEELGDVANGPYAYLKVVEIPDDVKWQLEEYDGTEWIAEQHRTWA